MTKRHPIMIQPDDIVAPGMVRGQTSIYREEDAIAIAAEIGSDDDWTYTVVAKGPGFAIEIKDEDGLAVGFL